jgi:hypothetical protein
MGLSGFLIWRYEVAPRTDCRRGETAGAGDDRTEKKHARSPEVVYRHDAWQPSLPNVQPRWLLMYRLFALAFFTVHNVVIVYNDRTILYFYTE